MEHRLSIAENFLALKFLVDEFTRPCDSLSGSRPQHGFHMPMRLFPRLHGSTDLPNGLIRGKHVG